MHPALMVFAGSALVGWVWYAIASDELRLRGTRRVRRVEQPELFWLYVAIFLLLGSVTLVKGILKAMAERTGGLNHSRGESD